MTRNSFNLSRKSNLTEAARNLYKFFRSIKKRGFKKIYVTKIPNFGIGIAINDRLKRASKTMKLEVKNLEKKFKDFTAVKNINFYIDEGQTLGVLGPNGCGKTTTIGMLLRIDQTIKW